MKNKFLKLLFGIMLVIASVFTQVAYANTFRSEQHSFYNNPRNDNPQSSTVDNGLEYYAQFSATNKLTGATEYSSKNWNTANNYDIYALIPNNADVYDMTNSTNLTLKGQLKNTTVADITVNISFELPNQLIGFDGSKISSNPVVGTYGSNFIVRYNYKGSNYTYEELIALPDLSWSDVVNVSFSGKLGAGEIANVSLPVALKTTSTDTVNVRVRSYAPTRQSTWLRIRPSNYMYSVDSMMTGVYVGAYRETVNGVDRYKQVPVHIQRLMPTVQKSDFVYNMFTRLYFEGQQADLTQQSDGVAYDQSVYLIATERIFNAVKDHGYSVYADDVRGLWNAYSYYMGSSLMIFDENGNQTQLGKDDATSGTTFSNYYVELHKIFDTKDIVITVGDAWQMFDNLTYRQSIAQNDQLSQTLRDDQIKVTHNVDTMTPGVYDVKYAYEVAPNKTVTITAKVTVVGKYTISYSFVSDTPDKPLPNEVLALLPNVQENVTTGTVVTAQQPTLSEVIVNGGKWVFKGYDNDTITVGATNVAIVGHWEFVADTSKEGQTTPHSADESNKSNLPKTGDTTAILIPVGSILVIAAIILVVVRKKTSRKK